MTSDEAISIMNVIVHMLEPQYDTDRIEDAVEMAIKALEHQPTDAVSRQAVLEILNDAYFLKLDDGAALQESVNQLPSVTPQPCDDCVSRQAVLDTIGNVPDYDDGMVWEALSHAQRDVALLPPVTAQPNVGQWKRISRDLYVQHAMAYYECSECGKKMIGTHNYCPNCGAKMQEVKNE